MKDIVPLQYTHLKFWPFDKAILKKMLVWNFLDPGGREFFFISGGYFNEGGGTSKQTLILF